MSIRSVPTSALESLQIIRPIHNVVEFSSACAHFNMGTGLNDLPQEVIDAIVDDVGASTRSLKYDALSAVSLAHRPFLPRAQYHIFVLSRFILRRSREKVSILGVLSPRTLALISDLELDFSLTSMNAAIYQRYPDVRSPRQQLPDTLRPLTGLSRRHAVWGERESDHPLLRCLVTEPHPWTTLELYYVVFSRLGDLVALGALDKSKNGRGVRGAKGRRR